MDSCSVAKWHECDGTPCWHRARAELAKIFAKIIATRRATGSKEDDMLQVNSHLLCHISAHENNTVQFSQPML